ncbi:hypothetical protein I5K74_30355, partial [Pseudomonas aeruginosa]|nr:hypothetical protein [Pseudomonas aeruginosa]
MTAVDLLLVATLLAALLAWWTPALPGRRGLLALASTLALGAGLYAAWDDRWQAGVGAFAGFSLLLGACLRRKPERGLPFRTGSLYGLLVLLAIAALYLFPVAPLPAPSGPYAVGVRDFELDDPSRPGRLGGPGGARPGRGGGGGAGAAPTGRGRAAPAGGARGGGRHPP